MKAYVSNLVLKKWFAESETDFQETKIKVKTVTKHIVTVFNYLFLSK